MYTHKVKKALVVWCISALIIITFAQIIFPKLIESLFSKEVIQAHKILFYMCKQVLFVLIPAFLWNNMVGNIQNKNLERSSLSFKKCIIIVIYATMIFVIIRLLRDAFLWIYIGITEDFSIYRIANSFGKIEILKIIFGCAILSAVCEEFYYRLIACRLMKNKSWILMVITAIVYAISYLEYGVGIAISAMLLGLVLENNYLQYHNCMYILGIHIIYGILEIYFTNCIVWVSDCILINVRAFSGAECIIWGCIYIVCACAIMLCVYGGKVKIQ